VRESKDIRISLKGRVRRLYVLTLLLYLLLAFLLVFGYLNVKRHMTINLYKNNSELQIDYLKGLILSRFQSIQSDIKFLPELNEMVRYLEIPNSPDREYIEREFLEFTKSRKIYDQIRFIDTEGMEIIRINNFDGSPEAVPRDQLQNKSNRYYFKETISLKPGQIYLSPLDLNVENDTLEEPVKPVIRICSPVFDKEGRSRGILVLNYLARNFLDDLRELTRSQPGTFALMNDEGFWLYADKPEDEWLFMYPERVSGGEAVRNPALWSGIQSHENGRFFINGGELYLVIDILPLSMTQVNVNNLHWYLINRIPLKDMGVFWSYILIQSLIAMLVLGVLGAYPLWMVLRTNLQRNLYRKELKRSALYDSLTKLPNRTLFMKKVELSLKEQKRYGFTFGVLFIDLDGFKAVNDNYGHEGGDILLKTVARRMKACVRSSDMVARMGGDEFVVLLSRVEDAGQCELVAGKILESIKEDVPVSGQTARVGASIGITLAVPGSNLDASHLIRQADDAMYKVKAGGKGHFQIFQ